MWYPTRFGPEAGIDNLQGLDNRRVAAFAQVLEMIHGTDGEPCRVLAGALDDFATLVSYDD